MLESSSKKLKGASVSDNVCIAVPKVDRGPFDMKPIFGRILDTRNSLYQIGIKVGIIGDRLARTAFTITDVRFDYDPETDLTSIVSIREAVSAISLTGRQGIKKYQCRTSRIQCTTNKWIYRKANLKCNSRCRHSFFIM